jgi:hypothetical protein
VGQARCQSHRHPREIPGSRRRGGPVPFEQLPPGCRSHAVRSKTPSDSSALLMGACGRPACRKSCPEMTPSSHTRIQEKASGTVWFRRLFQGWQMRDSNPRRRCQLIYSQPPLAARVICRTSKEDHSRLPCSERLFPVRSASSNRGQDNFTELLPKNRIGAWGPRKARNIRLLRGCGR